MWNLPAGYDFRVYEQWFQNFTQGYLQGSEFDVANVQLKRDHTRRVLDLARRISQEAEPVPELRELSLLAALFHDVGRFPQYARYQTFQDQLSVNHAYQGVITLKQHRVLAALPQAARSLVLGAVALHNRRHLPPGIPAALRTLTQIVRDADKLDIFAVMLAHFQPGAKHNKVVNLELRPHPDHYSPEVLAQVRQRRMANYYEMTWVNDFKLLLCSWIYDLNYPVSRAVVRERGYLEELLASLPLSPEIISLGEQLRQDMANGGANAAPGRPG